jgi:hypothetical protein
MSVESVLQRVAALEQALSNPASLLAGARTGGTAAPSEAAPEPPGASGAFSFADALQSASASYASPAASTGAALASGVGAAATASASGLPALTSAGPSTAASSATVASPYGYAPASLPGIGVPGTALGSPVGAGTSAGGRVIAIAESQIGQAEQPPGSNESPAIAQYRSATTGAIPGAPWCAYFASWAARQAGVPLGPQGEGLGSVSAIWSWAQSTGRAIPNGPGVVPQPGDLIVFGGEHVGIVKAVLPNGGIQTVEGNYENKVALNVRSPTEATGYVRLS